MDGGRLAASGFQYQYVKTVEWALNRLSAHSGEGETIRVEGDSSTDDPNQQVVDFELLSHDGSRNVVAQVKWRSPGNAMSAAEAFPILLRLIASGDAERYELITNAAAGPGLRKMARALAGTEMTSLNKVLAEVLQDAPKRLVELRSLSAHDAGRLGRCRILIDDRDDPTVRADLRALLWRYRTMRSNTGGPVGAGVLAGYIISEVMRRAADGDDCLFPLTSLQEMIMTPVGKIMASVGARQWVTAVGAIPQACTVRRDTISDALADQLGDRTEDDLRVRVSVLRGLSGIGKSSLAAQFIADRADSYTAIIWIDATNDDTIRASLVRVAATFSIGDRENSIDELVRGLVDLLTAATFSWLLVIDNAPDARSVAGLVPGIGPGDVILTTNNSTVAWPAGFVTDVPPMTEDEAVALFLQRCGTEFGDVLPSVVALVEELSYWPLAVEMVAAYVQSAGISGQQLPKLHNYLKERCLSDRDLIPLGYPRAVTEVVLLAIERLTNDVASPRLAEPPTEAFAALILMSYLSGHRIPSHLIISAIHTVGHPDYKSNELSAIYFEDTHQRVAELTRRLTSVSLARLDSPMTGGSHDAYEDLTGTLAMHALVQHVVRSQFDHVDQLGEFLSSVADHLRRWMTAALSTNDHMRLSVLHPHAEELTQHLMRLQIHTRSSVLLIGSTAILHQIYGQDGRALSTFQNELSILNSQNDPDGIIRQQILLSIVDISTSQAAPDYRLVVETLEFVYFHALSIALEHPQAAQFLFAHVKSHLNNVQLTTRSDIGLDLLRATEAASLSIPQSDFGNAMDEMNALARFVHFGDLEAAEPLALRLVRSDVLNSPSIIEAERLLAEIYARQFKFDAAADAWRRLLARCEGGLNSRSIQSAVINLGLPAAVAGLVFRVRAAQAFLKLLFSSKTAQQAITQASSADQYKCQILARVSEARIDFSAPGGDDQLDALAELAHSDVWARLATLCDHVESESA